MARPKSTPLYEELSYQEQSYLRARLVRIPHWTGDEVCVYLGIKRRRLNEIVSEGKLKRITGHGGERMFYRDEVFRVLEQNHKSVCEKLDAIGQ